MRFLIFGRTGQVATELRKALTNAGHDINVLSRDDTDLEDVPALKSAVLQSDADIIVNAAAYTDVDGAEKNRDIAFAINALAPLAIAQAAEEAGTPFIHISTDYVFDGSGEKPWKVEDKVNPINYYGFSKMEGERLVSSTSGRNVIMRTSWVFSEHGKNFVKTILRIGMAQEELKIVGDQIGGPTSASDIAKAILSIAEQEYDKEKIGTQIVHFCGYPFVSWAEFGKVIIKKAGLESTITGISTAEYPTEAARPNNSRLDGSAIASIYSIEIPDWRVALDNCLKRITKND